MALSSLTVWELRTTGSDLNGGGYSSGGTDYSQQDAAQVTADGAAIALTSAGASSAVTLVGVAGAAGHVGNVVQISGGTNAIAGFYVVTDYTATTWTLDRNWCSGACGNGVGRLGGALASPGKVAGLLEADHQVWVKAGTYPITYNFANYANGPLNLTVSPSTREMFWKAYAAARGDGAGIATFQATTAPTNKPIIAVMTAVLWFEGIVTDAGNRTGCRGWKFNGGSGARRCGAVNSLEAGFDCQATPSSLFLECEASSCGIGFLGYYNAVACHSHDNSAAGFSGSIYGVHIECIAHHNGSRGFSEAGVNYRCRAYSNNQSGFGLHGSGGYAINSLSESNGAYGFIALGGGASDSGVFGCATYNNTSGALNNVPHAADNVTVTAGSCLVDAAAGDYDVNDLANRGALLAGAGVPKEWPGLPSTAASPSIGGEVVSSGGAPSGACGRSAFLGREGMRRIFR
jgi:hypothetical protein